MIESNGTSRTISFLMITGILPKQDLRSQFTPKSHHHLPVQHSPETWEHNMAQPVVLARLQYSLSYHDRTNWPLVTGLRLTWSSRWRELWSHEKKLEKGFRIETLPNPEYMSKWRGVKISWLANHWGASSVKKRTTIFYGEKDTANVPRVCKVWPSHWSFWFLKLVIWKY